jgi:hypothetical protein
MITLHPRVRCNEARNNGIEARCRILSTRSDSVDVGAICGVTVTSGKRGRDVRSWLFVPRKVQRAGQVTRNGRTGSFGGTPPLARFVFVSLLVLDFIYNTRATATAFPVPGNPVAISHESG